MRKLKMNLTFSSLYQVLNIVIPLVTTPYLSRIIGAEGIGIYAYTFSIAAIFSMIAVFGGDTYGTRTLAQLSDDKREISAAFFEILLIQFIIAIAAISAYIAFVFNADRYQVVLYVQGLHILASMLSVNWFFYGRGDFKYVSIRNAFIKLLLLVSIFIFVKEKKDVLTYVALSSIADIACILSVWPKLLKETVFVKISMKATIRHIKPMLMLFIPVITTAVYQRVNKIMLGSLSSIDQSGYFENADKVINVFIALIAGIGLVLNAHISELISTEPEDGATNFVQKMINTIMFITVGIAFGIASVALPFSALFFGVDFSACGPLLKLYAPIIVIKAYSSLFFSAYLIPYKKDLTYIAATIIGAIISIASNYLLIPRYASYGAVVATLLAESAVTMYLVICTRRVFLPRKLITTMLPCVISGLIMYLTIVRISPNLVSGIFGIVLLTIAGACIYLIAYLVIGLTSHPSQTINQLKKVASLILRRRKGDKYS